MSNVEHLYRVTDRIAPHIIQFWEDKLDSDDPEFHMDELLNHVDRNVIAVAPDSPGRIMRDLRQHRLVNYEVVNRRQSLYRALPVAQ
jgi:hypothetical protein